MSLKVHRKCYHGNDLSYIFKEIDHEKEIRPSKRSSPFRPVLVRYPMFKLSTIQRYYKKWVDQNRPTSFVIKDKRKFNSKKRALPDSIESLISSSIISSYEKNKIVSYSNVSNMAIKEWNKLDHKPHSKFKASDGWVSNFMKRTCLSSLAVSKRPSSRNHKNIEDCQEDVAQYKKTYTDFVNKYGRDRIVNFDETSFGNITGQIRTIAPRGCKNQPRIQQCLTGRGASIGLTITANGDKLKSILVVQGTTNVSLRKYKEYRNDTRCVLTMSPSGWFGHTQMIMVLNVIHDHMKGLPCLCIWDDYKAHLTKDVIDHANHCNIQLLRVPKGLTSLLQPLDFKVNGPYKSKMKSHWIRNNYNENIMKDVSNSNLCETILKCYDDLNQDMIKKSFSCLD